MSRPLQFLLLALTGIAAAGQDASSAKTYRDFALRRDGNAERGQALFFAREKTACAFCHSIDGTASKAGPDLFAAGDKFPRRDLITALLEPSATIAVGYETTLVEMNSGESMVGVIKEAGPEWTGLMGPDGQMVRLRTADIRQQRTSPRSLMPEDMYTALTLQEFTDLVEFVARLKQPENSLASNRGMPAVIPELAKPVLLRPFFKEESRLPSSVVKKPGDVRSGMVWFGQVPGSPDVYLAVQQAGQIWRLEKNGGEERKTLFADFSGEIYSQRGPNGLLGLAFHPSFRTNRKYYLKHQVIEEGKIATVLVEKRAATNFRADSGEPSRRLLTIPSVTENHSGGCIAFGPDGMLYLGMGDTGPQQDPEGHGQDFSLLLGKMLRIDIDHRDAGLPYAIPPDNPFHGRAGARPEIWALGFREPWRFSFDSATGDLWVGDVGQDRVEEVTIVRRGENHGWNVYEGFEPFSNRRRQADAVYVPPVAAYRRSFGNSVTGGYVYRGGRASSFYGVYIFGDYTSRKIWGLMQENRTLKTIRQIATSPEGIASFATDEQGRVFVVGYEGMVYEMDFASGMFEPAPLANPATVMPPQRAARPALLR